MQHTTRSFASQAVTRHVANPLCKSRFVQMVPRKSDMKFTRYFFRECPRNWECSAASWNRTNECESFENEDDARARLLLHLTRSGHHSHHSLCKLQDSFNNAEISREQVPGHLMKDHPGPAVGEQVTSPGFHVAVDRKNYNSGKPPAQNVHPARNSLVHSGWPQIHHHIISGLPHIGILVCIADNLQRVNRSSWLHSGQPHILAAAFAPTLT